MEKRVILQELDRPHGINLPAMAAPVVKRWWKPSRLEQLPAVLHQAFNAMLEGRRGPVLIELAQDLQAELGEWDPPEPRAHRAQARPSGDRSEVARAAKVLAAAKRPVLLAGGGVVQSAGSEALVAIAQHPGPPLTHSHTGKSPIPHPPPPT